MTDERGKGLSTPKVLKLIVRVPLEIGSEDKRKSQWVETIYKRGS